MEQQTINTISTWPTVAALLIIAIVAVVAACFFIKRKAFTPTGPGTQEEARKQQELLQLQKQCAQLLSLEPYMHTLNEYSDRYCLLFGLQRERRGDAAFREHLQEEFVPMADIKGLSKTGFDLRPLEVHEIEGENRNLTPRQLQLQIDEQKDILKRFRRYQIAKAALEATSADLYRIMTAVTADRLDVPQIRADIDAMREKLERCGIYPKYYEEFLNDSENRRRFYKNEESQTDRPALFMLSGPDTYLLIGKEGCVKGGE